MTMSSTFWRNCILTMRWNPCSSPLLNKMHRNSKAEIDETVGNEKIDEIICRTRNHKDRVLPDLQARCGLRMGEVLKIRPLDISGRKITIQGQRVARKPKVLLCLSLELTDYKNTLVEKAYRIMPQYSS